MRLNVQTDYALRVLVVLAASPGRRWPMPTLASAYDISLDHLRKVTQRLVKGGVVVSTRGRGGGVELAPDAERTTVGDVVRLMEPDFDLVECMGPKNRCKLTPACGLIGVLHRARARFLEELDQVTLAQLTTTPAHMERALGLDLTSRP